MDAGVGLRSGRNVLQPDIGTSDPSIFNQHATAKQHWLLGSSLVVPSMTEVSPPLLLHHTRPGPRWTGNCPVPSAMLWHFVAASSHSASVHLAMVMEALSHQSDVGKTAPNRRGRIDPSHFPPQILGSEVCEQIKSPFWELRPWSNLQAGAYSRK